jgi:hypothetical protein
MYVCVCVYEQKYIAKKNNNNQINKRKGNVIVFALLL